MAQEMQRVHARNNVSAVELRAIVEKLEMLHAEYDAVDDEIKGVFAKARAAGRDVKAIKTKVLSRRGLREKFQIQRRLAFPVRISIYIITCMTDGRKYVGQSSRPARRWETHQSGDKTLIQRAIRDLGLKSFSFEIISSCATRGEANREECRLIRDLDLMNPTKGFNASPGVLRSLSEPEAVRNAAGVRT